jgi:hypothetical protein
MSFHGETVFDKIHCDVINDLRVWNTQRNYSRKVTFEDSVENKRKKIFYLFE